MSASKSRVVIVGGNFAGLVAASRLSQQFDVTVVDPRPEFEWTPNIHEIMSGVKCRDSVVLSRTDCVTRYGHTFVQDAVTHIDPESNSVSTGTGLVLPFDACLIAAGSQRTTFGVPGAQQHSLALRQVDDAVHIRDRLDKLAKRKRSASVVIVGEILRRRAQGDQYNVHVVEQAPRLLPQQPVSLADDAAKRCAEHQVQLHTDTSVTRVDARTVTLDSGEELAADLCIWSAGMTLPDFLRDAPLHDNEHGWLPVDETLKSDYADNIFVAGDCAALPDPIRKQAYYAMDMGKVAGDNIARYLKDRRLRRFYAATTPMLIAFGDLTTWLVAGDHVIASPLFAAAKEGVYQTTMARFASPDQPLQFASGLASRATLAAHRLLLPQLHPKAILNTITSSRVLQES